jgi:hypothetical protein
MASQTDTLFNVGDIEPQATTPASQIDPTIPVYGQPTTQSVRANFATAQTEITGLMQATQGGPFLPLGGSRMTGPMYLYNDPTDVMMPATKGYVDAGGGAGGGGLPEAPTDGKFYSRSQGAWVPCVALSGGTLSQMTGELLLAGNPADPLGATPKQYVDAIGSVANGAVPLAGTATTGPMTGLLVLSSDPTDPLGAVTKQYADTGLALKANAANPALTGIVTVSNTGRVIITGPTSPSLTLYNTTTNNPCFGIYNSGGYLSFGLATPSSGNPNGSPFATMDQTGNFAFAGKLTATSGRLISSSSGTQAASVTVNWTGMADIFGMWAGNVANNLLNFGLCDASGTPQTALTTMDGSGNWNVNGALAVRGAGTFEGNSLTIVPQSGQNPGVYLTNPGNTAGVSQYYYNASSNVVYINNVSSAASIQISANISVAPGPGANFIVSSGVGFQTGGGSWATLSDERIKRIKGDYKLGLDAVLALRPIEYVYRGNDAIEAGGSSIHAEAAEKGRKFVGLVAQEAELVFEGIVGKREGWIDGVAVDDLRTLDMTPLTFALINAVKTLEARVRALEMA